MSIDYAKLAQERFTGTKAHGYDQITAVSQGAIRRQMKWMFQMAEENAPIRKFHTDTTENDDWTCINDAELEASSVELLFENDDKKTVLFSLNLKSGTFRYLGGKASRPTEETATIQSWRLVFRVRLSLAILNDKDVPKFVQDVLIRPNDYSVHQLFVDFTTADISSYDESLSKIPLTTDASRLRFTEHIKLYLMKLSKDTGNFHSTIHYLPTIKKPKNYKAPTIAPTSLEFQNLPFVTSAADKGTKDDDKNMLLYLQMTQNRPFPKDLLPWPSANWVVPPVGSEPRYDGSVCLSKSTFLDGWLLPRLARFNEATSWVIKSITYDSSLTPLPFNIDAHLGYSKSELPSGGTPWVYSAEHSTPSMFYYTYNVARDHTRKTQTGPDGAFCQQDTGTWNHLEVPVGLNADGKCVIKVVGRTEVWSWASWKAWCISTTTWTASVTLDAVNHGRLMISVDFPKPTVVSEKGVASAWKKEIWEAVIADLNKRVEDGVDKVETVANDIKAEIEGLIGGQDSLWSFIFGGNDDFFIDKVAFNSEGDLLAQLIYQLKD